MFTLEDKSVGEEETFSAKVCDISRLWFSLEESEKCLFSESFTSGHSDEVFLFSSGDVETTEDAALGLSRADSKSSSYDLPTHHYSKKHLQYFMEKRNHAHQEYYV